MAQVVVITGASAGVGRATARRFAGPGVRLALLARGRDGLEAARREAEIAGARVLSLPVDVAEPDQVEEAAEIVEQELGPIDVWVNNAMASVFSPVHQTPPAEIRRVTEVTYLGSVYGVLAALRRMRPRDRGTIVQVGSALAYRSIPLQAAYCGAKHAIRGFLDTLRTELIHEGSHVQVTMVQLPALNTPQFNWVKSRLPRRAQPVPPIFQPEVAAEGIYYAAQHPRREIRVGWPTVKAVLGNKLIPGLLDHYLARTGYEAQQTDEIEDPDRPDNLWLPVPGDAGAHGRFDGRARGRSLQLMGTTHRGALALGAGLAGAAAMMIVALRLYGTSR